MRPTRREARHLAGLLIASSLLAACTDAVADSGFTTSPTPAASRAPATLVYAALGDSYTAAPFVPSTDLAGGCFRSTGNYPSLLATALDATTFVDVSCGGAQTADLLRPQEVAQGRGRVPAQIAAVTPRTDLVTLGIGGNDEGLFQTLVGQCPDYAGQSGRPCFDALEASATPPATKVRQVGAAVAEALGRIRAKAPGATVVLVGYPRLVDVAHPCKILPLATGDLRAAAGLERRLDTVLAASARSAGASYLSVRGLSKGHEICSADPWVNGPKTEQSAALAFHPFAAEQQAIATALAALVTPLGTQDD